MAHLRRPLLVAAQPERGLGVRATELLLARLVGAPPGAQKMTKPFRHEFLEVAQKAFGF
jgi:DNA-binding LacI/PurR family transcriptional regulator